MKKYQTLLFAAAAAAGLAFPVAAIEDAGKNVADVEYRTLPTDFENLPARETSKWNFGFRPYGMEAASVLWSDPSVIRSVSMDDAGEGKDLPTAVYVSCDEFGLNILGYGATRSAAKQLEKGGDLDDVCFECFFLPGDSDTPPVVNYQPFCVSSLYPYDGYRLSWMKEDRNNRSQFDDMTVAVRRSAGGAVVRIHIPWHVIWDRLPVFAEKRDNFWRLSIIRWGGSRGGETWGGRVHSQTKCGLIRMPSFTPEQEHAILKTTLEFLWSKYRLEKGRSGVAPAKTLPLDYYRKSIDDLPHTWMNFNEDPVFKEQILIPLIEERDAIGKKLAGFDAMTPAERRAFYLKNAPLLGNFHYDLEDASARYIKSKLMKH